MKVFGIVMLSLAAVFLIVVGVGALLPNHWRATRSVSIEAPPSSIHPYLEDFREWKKWATRNTKLDLNYRYEGESKGAGAVQVVSGQHARAGRMRITESDPQRGIRYETSQDGERTAQGSIRLRRQDGQTLVTWSERGRLPSIWGPFVRDPTQKQVGGYFERALYQLKDVAEARARVKP